MTQTINPFSCIHIVLHVPLGVSKFSFLNHFTLKYIHAPFHSFSFFVFFLFIVDVVVAVMEMYRQKQNEKKVEKKKMRDRRGDLEHYVFGSSNALWDEWGRGRKKVKWWWWWERKRRKRLEFVCVCTPKINHPLISRSSSLPQTSIFFPFWMTLQCEKSSR